MQDLYAENAKIIAAERNESHYLSRGPGHGRGQSTPSPQSDLLIHTVLTEIPAGVCVDIAALILKA